MEDYNSILRRGTKGKFLTVNMKNEPHGEVDINFANKFKDELGKLWILVDVHGNTHNVGYKRDAQKPLLTYGWAEMRSRYGLTGNHAILLRYVGDNYFQVTVFKKPSSSKTFPRFHSHYPKEIDYSEDEDEYEPTAIRKDCKKRIKKSSGKPKLLCGQSPIRKDTKKRVKSTSESPQLYERSAICKGSNKRVKTTTKHPQSFSITLTKYKATGSQLNLPKDFDDFLWNSGFTNLQLRGSAGTVTQCALLMRKVPRRRIKIGQGWKDFCYENHLRKGDKIVFKFVPSNGNLVNVRR